LLYYTEINHNIRQRNLLTSTKRNISLTSLSIFIALMLIAKKTEEELF